MRKLLVYFSLLAFVEISPIAGRGTWNASVGNYEYYASPSTTYKSYNSSLEECRRMDGELALITSAEIQSFLNNLVTSGSMPYAFYIGLQDLTKDGTFVWDDGEALGYTNWAANEPKSPGEENCVVAGYSYTYHDDLKWYDAACDDKGWPTGFFCQRLVGKIWTTWGEWSKCLCPAQRQRMRNCTDSGRTGPDSCTTSGEPAIENGTCWAPGCNITTPAVTTTARPLGRGHWFANGSFEYYVSAAREGISYKLSQEKCEEEDGELALVKSVQVQSFISSLVSENSGFPYGFYIGLKYDQEKNGFFWSDGSPLEYTHWRSGELKRNNNNSEDCVGMGFMNNYEEGLPWYDYACKIGSTGKKGRVCQRRIGNIWSSWGEWSSCLCPGQRQRERNCTDSGRTGPDSCTISGEPAIKNGTCWTPGCNITRPAVTTTARPLGFPYGFYIGLKYDQEKNGFFWSDGSPLEYTHWRSGEPNRNNNNSEDCVRVGFTYNYEEGLPWYDCACDIGSTGKNGMVCQRRIGKIWASWGEWSDCSCPGQRQRVRNCTDSGRPGPDSCTTSGEPSIENRTCWTPECNITTPAFTTTAQPPGRGNWFVNGSFEYYVSAANETFAYEMSQKKCQDEDGELALVKSPLVQSFISSLVSNGSGIPYGFYIGLKYDQEKNGFFWSDGSPLEYIHWQDGEPNRITNNITEDCVGVGYNYNYKEGLPWYDYPCDIGSAGKNGRVCQRRIGWHWSEWSNWTNCSCSLLTERTRSCTNSQRPGPDTCTRNSTLATESRNCSMSDISYLTTEISKDITLDHITTPGTESETTISAFLTNDFSSSSDEIEENILPFVIPIAAASGGLLLAVVGVTGFCLLKRKSTEKSKKSQYDATNENPMDHEYETIPRTHRQDVAEREYENICIMKQQTVAEHCELDLEGSSAIFKTPRSDQALYETPAKIDNRKDTLDHTGGYESVELQASESATKDESEYTTMKPSMRLFSDPRRPQCNDGYVTMHVANEGQ